MYHCAFRTSSLAVHTVTFSDCEMCLRGPNVAVLKRGDIDIDVGNWTRLKFFELNTIETYRDVERGSFLANCCERGFQWWAGGACFCPYANKASLPSHVPRPRHISTSPIGQGQVTNSAAVKGSLRSTTHVTYTRSERDPKFTSSFAYASGSKLAA
jgi:hypothetical protein